MECRHAESFYLDPQLQSRERNTGNVANLLKLQNLPLVTYLLKQGHTLNPSKTVGPTGTKYWNM